MRKTLEKMTLDEKIGQMFMADANAIFMNRGSDLYTAARAPCARQQGRRHHPVPQRRVGDGDPDESHAGSLRSCRCWSRRISRWGSACASTTRRGGRPTWASARRATRRAPAGRARPRLVEARAAGINWLYAPVADVNNNPDNPVINVRSYGEDPEQVARFVAAFVEGAQAAGAMACAKHFPGHGDTATDSHIGLPVVDVDRARLDAPRTRALPGGHRDAASARSCRRTSRCRRSTRRPWRPLRSLGAAERESAEFVSRTEEAGRSRVTRPATLSPPVLDGHPARRPRLRRTDRVRRHEHGRHCGALRPRHRGGRGHQGRHGRHREVPRHRRRRSRRVKAAVRNAARLPKRGIDASVTTHPRGEGTASGCTNVALVRLDDVDRMVTTASSIGVAQEIAERSMTVVRDERHVLPLRLRASASRVSHLSFGDDDGTFTTQVFVSGAAERKVPRRARLARRHARATRSSSALRRADGRGASTPSSSRASCARAAARGRLACRRPGCAW